MDVRGNISHVVCAVVAEGPMQIMKECSAVKAMLRAAAGGEVKEVYMRTMGLCTRYVRLRSALDNFPPVIVLDHVAIPW